MKEKFRMNSKPIRVIKKAERHHTDTVTRPNQGKLHPDRDVATQVARWIIEFEQKRRIASLRTFASLFEVMGSSNQT